MANEKRLVYIDEVETELRAYADRKHACGQTQLANGILKAVNHLKTISTAKDAVEVVRCKHCVSFGIYECTGNGYCRHYKGLVDPKPYNFCSYGERKEP